MDRGPFACLPPRARPDHVVGTGEARNDALGDRTKPRLHEASDVGYDSVFKCPIEVRGITAIVANDNDRPVRPAIAYAVEANLRTRGGCHFRGSWASGLFP